MKSSIVHRASSLVLAALILFALAGTAQAAQRTKFVITPATTNTDGTPVDGPLTYVMLCGSATQSYSSIVSGITTTTPTISSVASVLPDGLCYCTARETDIWGTSSDNSNEVTVLKRGTSFFISSGATPNHPLTLSTQ